jgi:hypothetical protein
MNKDITNLVLFIGICFIGYVFFIRMHFKEGLANRVGAAATDASSNSVSTSSSSSNGIAGNASTYASNLKMASVKLADTLLVTKYRSDYENAILNAEELINNMMLETTLSLDPSNPQEGIKKLVGLKEAQTALNLVMKFVDSS